MKTRLITAPLLVCIALLCVATQCPKEVPPKYNPDCKAGNCVNVNISGSLYVLPSGEKIEKIPVEVFFVEKGKKWFRDRQLVASESTNSKGEFNFRVTIDTTTFRDYFLEIRISKLPDFDTGTP